MVEVEYVERDGLVVSRDRGIPVGGVTVNICGEDVVADESGRFIMRIPRHGSCDVRTHKIEANALFLGPKRTVDSQIPSSPKPVKVREYGATDQVSLEQLRDLASRRLDEQSQAAPEHDPIAAALDIPDMSSKTSQILQSWLEADRQNSPAEQLKTLTKPSSTLVDYRESFWRGALSDL